MEDNNKQELTTTDVRNMMAAGLLFSLGLTVGIGSATQFNVSVASGVSTFVMVVLGVLIYVGLLRHGKTRPQQARVATYILAGIGLVLVVVGLMLSFLLPLYNPDKKSRRIGRADATHPHTNKQVPRSPHLPDLPGSNPQRRTPKLATPLNILGLVGSPSRRSVNALAMRAAQELAPEGMTIRSLDLAPIPFYAPDLDHTDRWPDVVRDLKTQVAAADALLFAIPEYNHNVPAVLTNALDWLSRGPQFVLQRKPAAMFGAASGQTGTARAQMLMLVMARSCGIFMLPQPEVYIREAQTKFDAEGRLTNEQTQAELRALLLELADWTRLLKR